MSSSFQLSGCIEHHIILVKVCRRSPQLRHLNLGPVLNGCRPLLISLSLWPQCLLAFSANYQPNDLFYQRTELPPQDLDELCARVCKTCRGKNVNVSRSRVQFWASTREFAKYPWEPAQASNEQNKQKVGGAKGSVQGSSEEQHIAWPLVTPNILWIQMLLRKSC